MAIEKNPKTKRAEAERASEWYAIHFHKCVVTRRATRSRFQKIDFFGCDTMGKKKDGTMVFIQVTAGNNTQVTKRRRKLEAIPWQDTDRVELLQLIQTINPANARRKKWYFRIHCYRRAAAGYREWVTEVQAYSIPKLWFKSYELYNKKNKNSTSDNK